MDGLSSTNLLEVAVRFQRLGRGEVMQYSLEELQAAYELALKPVTVIN